MMCVERGEPGKKFLSFQMGFKPMTVCTQVGCSSHQATGNVSGEQ